MPQYFDNDESLASERKLIYYRVEGLDFALYTDHGVFARDGLDYGSRALLKACVTSRFTGTVLDVGCGWGALGITLARLQPELQITMTDVNRRALELAKVNADKYSLTNCKIYESDAFSAIQESFDFIVTNPPIRAGKDVIYGIFDGAYAHLKLNGVLLVVIRKDQGAPSAMKHLESVFHNCELYLRDKGYHVLKCIKND